jgi:hypothetical protein
VSTNGSPTAETHEVVAEIVLPCGVSEVVAMTTALGEIHGPGLVVIYDGELARHDRLVLGKPRAREGAA